MTRPRGGATHTVAELEVSPETYTEIADALRKADYDHAFMPCGMIDMSGIGITASCAKDGGLPAKPAWGGGSPLAAAIANHPLGDEATVSQEALDKYDPREPLVIDWSHLSRGPDLARYHEFGSPQGDRQGGGPDAGEQHQGGGDRQAGLLRAVRGFGGAVVGLLLALAFACGLGAVDVLTGGEVNRAIGRLLAFLGIW